MDKVCHLLEDQQKTFSRRLEGGGGGGELEDI